MEPRLVPGTVLGGTFTIHRMIGRGGMGEVYEAEHVRLNGRVALKLLRRDLTADTEPYQRLRQEAELTSALRHPHIVQILDFQEHEGVPYIVMERLEGSDLGRRVKERGPLPLRTVVTMVDQVASALGAAHAKGVIHRDLKPENIFLVPMPEQRRDFAKVMDFGISKVLAGPTVLGRHSSVMGTPPYMSPEQAQGAADLDGRSDQFALATIAYEALSGQPAFQGEDIDTVFHQVMFKQPRALSRRVVGVPAEVDEVIRRGMAKVRDDRYPTIVEFARALQAAAKPAIKTGDSEITVPQPMAGVVHEVPSASDITKPEHLAPIAPPTPTTTVAAAGVTAPAAAPVEPPAPAPVAVAGATPEPALADSTSGIYLLVKHAAAAPSWRRRVSTILLASLAGAVVALGIAAFVLRHEIRDARRRAAEATANTVVPAR